jgi:hypothetical protein
VTQVFEQLAARSGLSPGETGAFVARLIRQRRYVEADRVALKVDRERKTGAIFDPAFEGRKATAPFVWRPLSAPGSQVGSGEAPGGRQGSALRIEWDGSANATLIRQLVVLRPGAYRLRAARFAEAGDTDRLKWQVVCADGGAELAAAGQAADAPRLWRRDEAELIVPAGCSAVWLALTATAPGSPGATIAWFTAVEVAPAV